MGNRLVITTSNVSKENADQNLGIYLHWAEGNGEEQVQKFLDKAKEQGIRSWDGDYTYFWARFCQIAANYISKEHHENECGIGLGLVSRLDCYNYDCGVIYIDENMEIATHTDGSELE